MTDRLPAVSEKPASEVQPHGKGRVHTKMIVQPLTTHRSVGLVVTFPREEKNSDQHGGHSLTERERRTAAGEESFQTLQYVSNKKMSEDYRGKGARCVAILLMLCARLL